ncbi:hypothetical protein [Desulforamulus putei]|nr:hypothetical protein [Desulforamulus putei]
MLTDRLWEQIKSLPPEEQRSLLDNLSDHLYQEEENHDPGLYNLDIF